MRYVKVSIPYSYYKSGITVTFFCPGKYFNSSLGIINDNIEKRKYLVGKCFNSSLGIINDILLCMKSLGFQVSIPP